MSEQDAQNTSVERVIMEANIREFGHSISLICALETGGKISPEEAYRLIKKTWQELKVSRKALFDGEKG
jgi:transcriptional regulator with AAA-type ATPase domain